MAIAPRACCSDAVRPWISLSLVLAASSAGAQPSGDPQRTAAAQALFTQAAELLKAGEVAAACPKLEEALRLEPSAVGGRLKLAECYERSGRLASAWGAYSVAEAGARAASQPEREKAAREKAADLAKRYSTLTLRPPRAAAGVVLERDGLAVGEGQLGTPVPVDGGSHRCVAYRDGKAYWERAVAVKVEGDAVVVDVPPPPLEAPPPPPPAPPAPAPLPPRPRPAVAPARGEVPVWAWVVGGAGLGLTAIGAALRADAAFVEAQQAAACGPALDQCPQSFDVAGTNRHKQDAFTAFVALEIAGGAALGAAIIGAAVGLSSPRRAPVALQPVLVIGSGGWLLGGGVAF